jgi:hypothetical protein
MNFINLTPHALNIFDSQGENLVIELPPSGSVARVSSSYQQVGEESDVPLFVTEYGDVEGLPEPASDTICIVSLLVRAALPDRIDLASPGDLIRDDQGHPVGCKGLTVNR